MKPDIVRTIDVFLEGVDNPLFVVVEPFQCGKTQLALEIAQHVNGEIINGIFQKFYENSDSDLNVEAPESREVPHYFFGIFDPKEEVDVTQYQSDAVAVIADIQSKGKVPVLVGDSPKLLSFLIHEQKISSAGTLCLGIHYLRGELKKYIPQHVEQLIEEGWIDEVRDLMTRGYTAEDPGMQSVGYPEIIRYLSEIDAGGDVDEDMMKEQLAKKIASKMRQHARKQISWWKGVKGIRWITV